MTLKLPKRNKIDYNNNDIDYTVKYKNSIGFKPNGYWYSCNNSWYNWIIEEKMLEWLHNYIYKININRNVITDIRNKDKNKLLVIKNIADLDTFNDMYGVQTKDYYRIINWSKVSKDYGGIEICPYFISKKFDYIWYNTFDVASGCIWNTKAIIKNIELIYKKKNKEYIKV